MKKLYVGNLPYSMTDESMNALFAEAGAVIKAEVIRDRMTGRSRGFGFVEMADDAGAEAAISQFNGKDVEGRALVVNEARPPVAGGRSDRGGSRGGFGGGGRGN